LTVKMTILRSSINYQKQTKNRLF